MIRMKKLSHHLKQGTAKGTREALQIMAKASQQQTPRHTGALLESCSVRMNSNGCSGQVEYATSYAAKVHQDTKARHYTGKAGFLRDAARDTTIRRRMSDRLKNSIASEWRK